MPGVPSGKGCDACRKQKKKCDQLKPSCSRCSRLDIPCIGSGQQRYKFLHEDGASPSSNTKPSQRGRKNSSSSSSSSSGASRSLSRTPSNGQSLLTNVLVSKLKAKDDLRYHLTWTYGSILEDIPKRLGTNAALDTAVNALVCAHTHHAATQGALPDSESLTKYIHAVKTLRHCLDDPVKAREANTLCAIYLLMICHLHLGTYTNGSASHSEGAAIILKARGYYNPQDDFEQKLLLTLRGPVLFEFLVNYKSKTSFTREEWNFLIVNELDATHPSGDMMYRLANIPDLMERGRFALLSNSSTASLIFEARQQYDATKTILSGQQDSYDKIRHTPVTSLLAMRLHSLHQRMYALALSVSLIFNCVLRALGANDATTTSSSGNDTDLEKDASDLCSKFLVLTDEAEIYRPLGSSYLTLFLSIAWAACSDETMKTTLESKVIEYSMDFPGQTAEDMKGHLEMTAKRLFLLSS